jgi:hypothetical protein
LEDNQSQIYVESGIFVARLSGFHVSLEVSGGPQRHKPTPLLLTPLLNIVAVEGIRHTERKREGQRERELEQEKKERRS